MKRYKVKKKLGFLRLLFLLALTLFLLYFLVGEGKTELLKKVYPIKYSEYVESYASEYSVDKYLVYAIIKTESGFDPDAVSNVGAKGLMQVMEKTAAEVNEKEGFGYTIPESLYDPEKNIRIGCCYLKKLMDTYSDAVLAITAYNGGTGNVRKWLKDENLSNGEGGLSTIPYKETDNYVKKVMKAYDMYIKLYKTSEI